MEEEEEARALPPEKEVIVGEKGERKGAYISRELTESRRNGGQADEERRWERAGARARATMKRRDIG